MNRFWQSVPGVTYPAISSVQAEREARRAAVLAAWDAMRPIDRCVKRAAAEAGCKGDTAREILRSAGRLERRARVIPLGGTITDTDWAKGIASARARRAARKGTQ